MTAPQHLDLRADSSAIRVCKRPVLVNVLFASRAGSLATLEGLVHFSAGDAILTGSNGEQWPIARDTFIATYEPAGLGETTSPNMYRKRSIVVLAKQLTRETHVAIGPTGDSLAGFAGDWLVQYAPGKYGIVKQHLFCESYDIVSSAEISHALGSASQNQTPP